jgi:hypothetical protein
MQWRVDHRAGRAHVARGARAPVPQAAEVLVLDRDREVLVARHRARVLRVDHDAAVAQRVARRTGIELAHESVLVRDEIVGVRLVVVEVAELCIVVATVAVVAGLDHPVDDAEGVGVVLADLVLGELRRPAVEVPAVEEVDPFLAVGIAAGGAELGASASAGGDGKDRRDAKAAQRSCVRGVLQRNLRMVDDRAHRIIAECLFRTRTRGCAR